MTTITGTLDGVDYGDNVTHGLTAGDYSYSLTNLGPGRLAFKVEVQDVPDLGDDAPSKWRTIEEKSKLPDGEVLEGKFTVAPGTLTYRSVRFNFNREFLSKKTAYKLVYQPS